MPMARGLLEEDYPAIEAAVTAHSAPKEVSKDSQHWPLIALLKDADGLDRVRLGALRAVDGGREQARLATSAWAPRLRGVTAQADECGFKD